MFSKGEINAICIDLDNTLWPVDEVLRRAERVTFDWLSEHYPEVTRKHDLESMRRVRMQVARDLADKRHDLTHLRRQALLSHAEECGYGPELADGAYDVFFAARCDVSCFSEVENALALLAAAYPLLAVTNGNACLERCGVARYFVGCVYARDVGASKPSPEVFAAAAARLDADPATILHVGDDPMADVHGASAAGMRTIWLNREGQRWDRPDCAPDAQVSDFDELLALLGIDSTEEAKGGRAL